MCYMYRWTSSQALLPLQHQKHQTCAKENELASARFRVFKLLETPLREQTYLCQTHRSWQRRRVRSRVRRSVQIFKSNMARPRYRHEYLGFLSRLGSLKGGQ